MKKHKQRESLEECDFRNAVFVIIEFDEWHLGELNFLWLPEVVERLTSNQLDLILPFLTEKIS